MSTNTVHKIDTHRRLCILKDLRELELWLQSLEGFSEDLNHFKIIDNQIVKNDLVSKKIKALQRKTVLMIASLCKYEQELKTEYEYGKVEYNTLRLKIHVQRQQNYLLLLKEQQEFKVLIFTQLRRFKR
ncbi:hypothetical protein [Psychroserpens sp. S379A]|uniref:hypothetical protein n=1 Tax=Psychroserpens sp. S379A TaxID=3415137 RepID=UPI003C7AD33E